MKRLVLLAAVLVASALPATADDCENPADQLGINACAAAEQAEALSVLDSLYVDLEARLLGDEAKLALMNSARDAGTAFREAECAFAASGVEGGSMQPAIHAGCMADLLTQRAAQLRTYLECPEGDLSCPVPWLQ